MGRFKNKVALVTGGAKGIGRAIAEAFLYEDARVAILDVDCEAGSELAKKSGILYIKGDAASEADLLNFVNQSVAAYGKVSFLINNACVGAGGLLSGCSAEAFDRCLAIGLRAPYLLTQACLPYMNEDDSPAIINIASTRAFMSEPDTESYSAAKGGIIALTHAMAVSLGPGVRVNSVSPGWIETGEYQGYERDPITHKDSDRLQHPAGRVGNPEDIASAVMFLCSKEASFITGQNLTIDGGMTKRMIYSGDWGWNYVT